MSRVLAVVFEEDDLRDLRQIWHAFDAISTLASHPMEANLHTIGALADIAARQLEQLLDENRWAAAGSPTSMTSRRTSPAMTPTWTNGSLRWPPHRVGMLAHLSHTGGQACPP